MKLKTYCWTFIFIYYINIRAHLNISTVKIPISALYPISASSPISAPGNTCFSFGHPLALTCDGLRWLWSSSNSYASPRKFWPPNSTVYAWKLRLLRLAWTCESTCESVWPPIASPCASSGFANLRRLASPLARALGFCLISMLFRRIRMSSHCCLLVSFINSN